MALGVFAVAGKRKQAGRRRAQVIPRVNKSGETVYLVRVPMGTDADGKRVYWTKTVRGRLKDAEAVATEKLNERDKHSLVQPTRMTVDAYMEHWLKIAAKPRLRTRTFADYENQHRRYIRPAIGGRRLADLTTMDVQTLYSGMLERGLSARTVRYCHAVLSSALKQAVRWGMVARNVAELADLPRQERREMHALTPEQATRFLLAAASPTIRTLGSSTLVVDLDEDQVTLAMAPSVTITLEHRPAVPTDLRPGDAVALTFNSHGRVTSIAASRTPLRLTCHRTLFDFALATGMRPEEYLALRWDAVDLKAGTATVQRVLVRVKGAGYRFAEPKTPRSRRTVPLPASTVRLLDGWKHRQAEAIIAAGEAYERLGLVFPADNGHPMHLGNLSQRHFKRIVRAAGLPDIRLYDLRHTCATLLLAAGVNPKVVSERLGHASVTLTLDTYSHVLPTMQQDAAERLERLLHGR